GWCGWHRKTGEPRGPRPRLRAPRRGEDRPAMVFLGMTPHLDVRHQAIPGLGRGWVRLRWPSSPGAARAAALGHDAIAERVIPPGARLAASAALPSALILGDGGLGIGPAGTPPGVPLSHVVGHGLRFLHWRPGRGLGVLLRQLTRMPHDKAHLFLPDPLITILHLSLPHDALPMPAAGRFRLGPPRFLDEQGQGELLLSPGCECLPYGTGARDACDQVDLVLQTQAQRAATIGLTIRHNPTYPLQTQRQTFLNREWRFHTITPVAITNADA